MSDHIRQISVVGRADQFGEQLSALMDGELAHDQVRFLLRSVEAESDLARRWSSYHVIGATLRREVVALPLRENFSKSIFERLDGESVGVAQAASRRRFGAVRWLGGGAIAAAVAVVAIVVSGPVGEGDRRGENAPLGPMVAQSAAPASSPATRSEAYLPLLRNGLMPASDVTLLRDYYTPNGSIVPRDYFSQGAEPYVLFVNPQTQRVEQQAPFPVQSGAPQK
jgi:hypothetical protein